MAISKTMESALNKQINEEMYSAYLYMSMSADFEDKNLKGFANWMTVQAKEEMTHAMKIYNFIIERGGKVLLDKIEKPKTTWNKPLDAFKEAYEHEKHITKCIHDLVDMAIKEKDHSSNSMLQWFVDEQVEEESNADEIVNKLTLAGNNTGALFMMDKELGTRVFVDATAAGGQ